MAAEEKKRYIYCVIPRNKEKKFDLVGLEEEEIYTINYKDIAAVASNISVSFEECDPTRRNMKAHTLVLEMLMKDYTILPARFGLISDSDDKLKGLLQRYYSTLKDRIRRLDDRIEAGVKVFWQKEAMVVWIVAKSERIAKIKERVKTLPPDKAQPLLIEAGQLVKSLVDKWRGQYYPRVYRKLLRVAVDGRYNPAISMDNLLNASFLVDKAKEKQFDNLIDKLDSEYGERVNFKVVKPIPPYNFVDLKLYLKEVL